MNSNSPQAITNKHTQFTVGCKWMYMHWARNFKPFKNPGRRFYSESILYILLSAGILEQSMGARTRVGIWGCRTGPPA
jgi:hypothetical protein